MARFIGCRPKSLPSARIITAAQRAVTINPANSPSGQRLNGLGLAPTQLKLAIATEKYWGKKGTRLTVGFLEHAAPALAKKIIQHLNAWGKSANILFRASQTDPQVRIAFRDHPPSDAGFWSYVGTDILEIAPHEPTMNLEGFTVNTPDKEFHRVVRHEAGHTLGFEHEHMRRQIVARIDRAKAIAFYRRDQGWDEQAVDAQVLTPLEDSSIMGTPNADETSIMCYDIPGEITLDGKPIVGGNDINATDFAFAGLKYPKPKKKPKGKKPKPKKPKGKSAKGTNRKKKSG